MEMPLLFISFPPQLGARIAEAITANSTPWRSALIRKRPSTLHLLARFLHAEVWEAQASGAEDTDLVLAARS